MQAKRTIASGQKPRVLVFAHAAEPARGSEAGAGWGVTRALSNLADLHSPCRARTRSGCSRLARAISPTPACHSLRVPEPSFSSFAKWHRVPRFLVYLGWLRAAGREAQRLHSERAFDAAAHVSCSVYWLPTPVTQLGIPCLWGPVGGAVTTPRSLWSVLGLRGIPDEFLDFISVRLMARLPWTRRTWRGATVPIVQNEETLAQLPGTIQSRATVLNHVLFTDMPVVRPRERKAYIVYCAGLLNRKGPSLALRALAYTPEEVQLQIAGDGPELNHLKRLAKRLDVSSRVEFLGAIPRTELFDLLAESAAAVFTGLREEGGMALAEAMLCGTPVIVLANGGARTIAEKSTDPDRVMLVEPGSAERTANRIGAAMAYFSQNITSSTGPTIDQTLARKVLKDRLQLALSGNDATRGTDIELRASSLGEIA